MVPSFVTPASREYKPNYPAPHPLLAEPAVCQIKILVNFGTSLWQDPRQANVLSVWRFRQGNILGGGHHPANTPHPCQTHATFPSLLPSAIMFSVNYPPPPSQVLPCGVCGSGEGGGVGGGARIASRTRQHDTGHPADHSTVFLSACGARPARAHTWWGRRRDGWSGEGNRLVS